MNDGLLLDDDKICLVATLLPVVMVMKAVDEGIICIATSNNVLHVRALKSLNDSILNIFPNSF